MSALALCCFSLALVAAPPETATLEDDVTYTVNSRRFKIPIYIDPNAEREKIESLVLYCSSDKGKSWREVTKVCPDQKHFLFAAPGDGTYWFTVQVINNDDTKVPVNIDKAKPNLKVGVATVSKSMRKSAQANELEREVSHLREKVEKLEKRIAELEKQSKTKR